MENGGLFIFLTSLICCKVPSYSVAKTIPKVARNWQGSWYTDRPVIVTTDRQSYLHFATKPHNIDTVLTRQKNGKNMLKSTSGLSFRKRLSENSVNRFAVDADGVFKNQPKMSNPDDRGWNSDDGKGGVQKEKQSPSFGQGINGEYQSPPFGQGINGEYQSPPFGQGINGEYQSPPFGQDYGHRFSLATCHSWCKHDLVDGLECCRQLSYNNIDCNCCKLLEIPQFPNPERLIYLTLAFNNLNQTAFSRNMFVNYTNLRALNLSCNDISWIEEGTFNGLSKLVDLSLQWNYIKMNQELNNSKIFQPLAGSLRTLYLHGNNPNMSDSHLVYPDHALSKLTKLSALHLDGIFNQTFGKGFSKLKHLHFLNLAGFSPGFCNLTILRSNTFEHVSHVTHLYIRACNIHKDFVHNETFSPLVNLVEVDISDNFELSIQMMGKLMFGQRNNIKFRHLKIQRIGTRFAACIVVFKDDLKYFTNTSLQIIEAPGNGIEMIEYGALNNLPPTLKKIDLRNNKIMFGAYWKNFHKLTKLKDISLASDNNRAFDFPQELPARKLNCHRHKIKSLAEKEYPSDYDKLDSFHASRMILPLPPKLKTASMEYASMAYNINGLSFSKNNSLKAVRLKGNIFKRLTGEIKGLHSLTDLDLSICRIEDISETFLNSFKSLERLDLSQNELGNTFFADKNGTTFSTMKHLKHLNLSSSNLFNLSSNFFSDCESLQTLDLSSNRLHDIRYDFSNMKSLSSLLLSKNDITTMGISAMKHIDEMGHNFKLDLRYNPIRCDCSNLHFLNWLNDHNEIMYGNRSVYYCMISDLTQKKMPDGYSDIVRVLNRQCRNNLNLFIVVFAVTIIILLIVITFIVYRFRWSLKYWYYTAKMMVSSNSGSRGQHQSYQFVYDIFVSYANDDEEFVAESMVKELSTQRGIQLMLHGQSFRAGRMIIDNIIMAVRQCRKTLVVITKSMLKSKWCLCELQMARMEEVNTGRRVLMFLLLEKIAYKDMDWEIVDYIKSHSVSLYPTDIRRHKFFWDKLAFDLKKN